MKFKKNPYTRAEFIFNVIQKSNFEEIKKISIPRWSNEKIKSIYYSNKFKVMKK